MSVYEHTYMHVTSHCTSFQICMHTYDRRACVWALTHTCRHALIHASGHSPGTTNHRASRAGMQSDRPSNLRNSNAYNVTCRHKPACARYIQTITIPPGAQRHAYTHTGALAYSPADRPAARPGQVAPCVACTACAPRALTQL